MSTLLISGAMANNDNVMSDLVQRFEDLRINGELMIVLVETALVT